MINDFSRRLNKTICWPNFVIVNEKEEYMLFDDSRICEQIIMVLLVAGSFIPQFNPLWFNRSIYARNLGAPATVSTLTRTQKP